MRDLKGKAANLAAVGYGWLCEKKAMDDNWSVEERICASDPIRWLERIEEVSEQVKLNV